jgi:type IX secretion system PorP/SprF family membrane protein
MKGSTVILILIFIATFGKAQELPLYSQYILNPYLINPAIAGIDGCGNIQAVSSIKWAGIKQSPKTYAISYHQGFNKIGLGSFVFSDQNGFNSDLGFQITFAYHINLNNSRKNTKQLSFGISFSGNQHTLDESKFVNDGYDPVVSGVVQNSFIADANAGVYFISGNFFSGLSCANLFRTKNKIFTSELEPLKYRNYFYQAGYAFRMNKNIIFEPSLTAKLSESSDKQIDTNIKLIFDTRTHNKIWVALSLRKSTFFDSFNSLTYMPLVGYNNANFSFAYSFNYSTGSVSQRAYGSHEIMLGYHFCLKKRRIVSCPAFRSFRTQKN